MHPSKHRADASSGQIASILRCVTSNPKGRVSVGDMSLTPIIVLLAYTLVDI